MKRLYELEELVLKKIDEINKKGDITPTEMHSLYEAVDVLKDIKTICAMEEALEHDEGYSEKGYSYGTMRHPYFHTYDHTMDRNRMGRYTRDDHTINKLEKMMASTSDPTTRAAISRCIDEMS